MSKKAYRQEADKQASRQTEKLPQHYRIRTSVCRIMWRHQKIGNLTVIYCNTKTSGQNDKKTDRYESDSAGNKFTLEQVDNRQTEKKGWRVRIVRQKESQKAKLLMTKQQTDKNENCMCIFVHIHKKRGKTHRREAHQQTDEATKKDNKWLKELYERSIA